MKELRVGFDLSPLALTRAGTARHVRELASALEIEPEVDLCRYAFPGAGRAMAVARDVLWYPALLPAKAARDGANVLHCPTFRSPMHSAAPLVVTFHDLAVLRHPSAFNAWTRRYSEFMLPRIARAAARIIAVSEFTRDEIIELLAVPEEKLRVIPNGVGAPFCSEGPASEGDFVLAVSTLEPRKNLERLVEGFRRARIDGCELRVVGMRGWGGVTLNGDRVRWLGFVPDDELARLYRGARAVAYISLYEGFGLPVLEALACGATVVASDLPPIREFAGGRTLPVDPHDPDAIAAGLEEALRRGRSGDPLLGGAFDWPQIARETAAVYREIAA